MLEVIEEKLKQHNETTVSDPARENAGGGWMEDLKEHRILPIIHRTTALLNATATKTERTLILALSRISHA